MAGAKPQATVSRLAAHRLLQLAPSESVFLGFCLYVFTLKGSRWRVEGPLGFRGDCVHVCMCACVGSGWLKG